MKRDNDNQFGVQRNIRIPSKTGLRLTHVITGIAIRRMTVGIFFLFFFFPFIFSKIKRKRKIEEITPKRGCNA